MGSHIIRENWFTFMDHTSSKCFIVSRTEVSWENNVQFPFAFCICNKILVIYIHIKKLHRPSFSFLKNLKIIFIIIFIFLCFLCAFPLRMKQIIYFSMYVRNMWNDKLLCKRKDKWNLRKQRHLGFGWHL